LINGFEGSPKAHLYNLAVADQAGDLMFSKVKGISGHNSLYPQDEENEMVRVKSVSLDEHLQTVGKIDIIKVDVEGAEPLVLKGMKDIIAKNPEIRIIMEYDPNNLRRANVDTTEFIDQVEQQGLVIQIINAITGELTSPSSDDLMRSNTENLLLTRR
jgi:hypothetical protein